MDLCLLPFARNGNTIVQYVAVLAATLQIITSGMLYGWPSIALPELLHPQQFNLNVYVNSEEGSWLAILPLIGSLCASTFANYLTKLFGRKTTLQLTAIPFIISWILVTLARNINLLFIGRFIGGISDGLVFIVGPMYVAEIASPSIRGRLASLMTIFLMIGVILINIVGYFLNMYYAGLIAIISPSVSLILLIFVPESPYGLILNNQPKKAKICLKIFRGEHNVDEEYSKIEQAVQMQMVENKGQFIDLFTTRSNRKSVFILLLVNASQQLSGITAITFYITTILQHSGLNFPPFYGTISFFVVQLLVTILSFYLVDTKGRRFLLLLSCSGCFISLLLGGFYYQYASAFSSPLIRLIPLIVLILYVIFYSVGLQCVPILMMGEIFPTNLNAWALSLTEVYYDVMASLVSKMFQVVNDIFGIHVVFYVFASCCFISIILIRFAVPETKGISLEEIQHLLKEEKRGRNNSEVIFVNDCENKYYGTDPYML